MSNPILELKEVSAGYGQIKVLKNISIQVDELETVCFLGGNAAGKTTTMKVIMGIVPLWSGKISSSGINISNISTTDIVKNGIALVPEGRRIFPKMTVLENLEIGSYLRKDKEIQTDIEKMFTRFPRLKERYKQLAGTLSGGEQQMLAIGRALMSRPKMLLLDEPSMGLAPALVETVFEIIKEINKKEKTAVFLVEQNASMALSISDRGYVIQQGEIVLSGKGTALLQSEEIKHAYLGGS